VAGREADEVQRLLAKARINVSVSRVSSTRLDMEARNLPDLVRASVHYYNTDEEIARFCATLAAM
jgi:selenocysteine lyase/cysteine desulfurase